MLAVVAATVDRDRVPRLLRRRQILHLEQGNRHIPQEFRLHGPRLVYKHSREVLIIPFVDRNIDHQLPDRRRIRAAWVQTTVHGQWNALHQAQLVDNGVDHSVLERGRQQGIAEGPGTRKLVPLLFIIGVLLVVMDP